MSSSAFRAWISFLILGSYLTTFGLLGLGISRLWIDLKDAKEVTAAVAPLFSGYISGMIGYFFAKKKKKPAAGRRPDVGVPPPAIAWLCLAGTAMLCGALPAALVLNFFNKVPFALQENLITTLSLAQSALGVFVGGLMAVMFAKVEV